MNKLISALFAACVLAACASPNSAGNMAIGDDSAAIKAGRNRMSAELSRSELEQQRRQRTNTAEEIALEEQKRRNKHEGIRDTMRTTSGGLGVINEAIGTIRNLRWGF
ncbi:MULTISPECIES: NGK_0946 family protein [Neisseria]|uniref:Lipoprotein n=2 Tax=Neisseria musculi TaxID=1815583 RepID=A0A7H1MDL5_9NEIS|nr:MULTISPECIES: hypothetical protein [Neisseria]MBF0804075.1 hypothetical protein [Neisseria sp. 19428wB4_WF04]QNT59730.1 hypothetical protein H7A79_0186 [Neisseria musculi]TFU43212.1 hypothetical protein E4T99_06840 [Neisseria sp. WF04]